MRGLGLGLILLLLLAAIAAGFVMWVRRSQKPSVSIQKAPAGVGERTRTSISLLTEAIISIGAILVLAGGAIALGQSWDQLTNSTQLAILGGATVVFLAIGASTRSSAEPAFRRLTRVTWALSVGTIAGSIVVVNQILDAEDATAFLTTATISTAYAVLLWRWNTHAIQHAVIFAGVLVSAAAIWTRAIHDPAPWIVAVTLWAIAVAWAWFGWNRRLQPWWIAVPIGLVVALIAPSAIDNYPAMYALGIGTAAAVMALSVAGKFSPGLAVGAVAMLGYVVGAVTHYFSDTLGVPAALALTGVLILALGAVSARLFRITSRGTRHADGDKHHDAPSGRKAA